MTVKEYLLTTKEISLRDLAGKMWPNNRNAESYLNRKLRGAKPFTDKDNELARKALSELGHKLLALE